MSNPGDAALLAHVSVCLYPGRQRGVLLGPVGDGRLIAPIQEMRHGPFVCVRGHEVAHLLLGVPRCHGPVRPVSIREKRTTLKAGRPPDLPQRAMGIENKKREKTNRTDPEASETDEGHGPLTIAAWKRGALRLM